jgi:hypothetical protein
LRTGKFHQAPRIICGVDRTEHRAAGLLPKKPGVACSRSCLAIPWVGMPAERPSPSCRPAERLLDTSEPQCNGALETNRRDGDQILRSPLWIQPFIPQTSERARVWGYSRPRRIGPDVLPAPPKRLVAEACIAARPYFTNVGSAQVKSAQEFDAARLCAGIAAPQFHIPQQRRIRFQTEQQVIGALASIARIVTNRSPFLTAKDRDHGTIQI